ncbi:MAG: hypothetical protein AB7T49_17360 [Oligoflexales bacterium]
MQNRLSPEKTPMPRKSGPERFPDTCIPDAEIPEDDVPSHTRPSGRPRERKDPLHEGTQDKPSVNPEDDVPPKD